MAFFKKLVPAGPGKVVVHLVELNLGRLFSTGSCSAKKKNGNKSQGKGRLGGKIG